MIDWKQFNYKDEVCLTDVDGDVIYGRVECVTDSNERSDLEKQEIGIGIVVNDGRHIEFYESEINSIIKLNVSQPRDLVIA